MDLVKYTALFAWHPNGVIPRRSRQFIKSRNGKYYRKYTQDYPIPPTRAKRHRIGEVKIGTATYEPSSHMPFQSPGTDYLVKGIGKKLGFTDKDLEFDKDCNVKFAPVKSDLGRNGRKDNSNPESPKSNNSFKVTESNYNSKSSKSNKSFKFTGGNSNISRGNSNSKSSKSNNALLYGGLGVGALGAAYGYYRYRKWKKKHEDEYGY